MASCVPFHDSYMAVLFIPGVGMPASNKCMGDCTSFNQNGWDQWDTNTTGIVTGEDSRVQIRTGARVSSKEPFGTVDKRHFFLHGVVEYAL